MYNHNTVSTVGIVVQYTAVGLQQKDKALVQQYTNRRLYNYTVLVLQFSLRSCCGMSATHSNLARPADTQQKARRTTICLFSVDVSYLFYYGFLSDQYLNIHLTNLRQILLISRTRLWLCLKMISLQLVFGPSRSVAMTNSFLFFVSTQLTFGDIRQMALAYDKNSGSWVLLDT